MQEVYMKKDLEYIQSIIDDIPQLQYLDKTELNVLVQYINCERINKGTVLFKEGTIGKTLYFIGVGKVEIKKESLSGNQAVLAQYGKGASIGEMSLLDEAPRSATATVVEDAELLMLNKNEFDEILDKYPWIGIKILKNIAKQISMRLRHTSGRFADVFDTR
jgi:CRP-like cAMP-binding protein